MAFLPGICEDELSEPCLDETMRKCRSKGMKQAVVARCQAFEFNRRA